MKKALLLAALIAPGTCMAQHAPARPQRQVVAPETSEEDYVDSSSLMYREGYNIARPAFLYRSLADARRGRVAHRLRVGDQVYSNNMYYGYGPRPAWLRVARFTYLKSTGPDRDSREYYLPLAAVLDKQGAFSTFALH